MNLSMTKQRGHHQPLMRVSVIFVLLTFCHASARSNSKRLRWDEVPADLSGHPQYRDNNQGLPSKGERGLTFINNMAYNLSRKHQKMMWDLYLRKGYGPSLSTLDDDRHGDFPSPGSSFPGTATVVQVESVSDYEKGHLLEEEENELVRRPDIISSRILDQYDAKKSSNIVPKYRYDISSEMAENELEFHPKKAEALAITPKTTVEDINNNNNKMTPSAPEETSLLSYFWSFLKDNLGDLLGREMRDTILNTLWSWWDSVVNFVKSRGKREIQGSLLHSMTF